MNRWRQIGLLVAAVCIMGTQILWAAESHRDYGRMGPMLRQKLSGGASALSGAAAGEAGQPEAGLPAEPVKVIVTLRGDPLQPLPDELREALRQRVAKLGGRTGEAAFNRVQVWIDPAQIEALLAWEEIRRIELPHRPRLNAITSEGVAVMAANQWQLGGRDGTGVKAGVIDVGFQGYAALLGTELPSEVTTQALGSLDDFESTVHGVACAEILHDVAPGAALYLVNITDVEVGFHTAVAWLEAQGVEVVSCSTVLNILYLCQSAYLALIFSLDAADIEAEFVYFEEVEAQWNASINRLIAGGTTWVQAGGNYGRQQWVGRFADTDGDAFLNFTAGENFNEIELPARFRFGQDAYVLMTWEPDAGQVALSDYDLFIVDSQGNLADFSTIDQALLPQGIEACRFVPLPGERYFAYVEQFSGGPQPIRLLLGLSDFAIFNRFTPEGTVSLSPPADNPEVLTAGAVAFDAPAVLEPFSSQGPGVAGVLKPELVAPDGVATASYFPAPFLGTSAAAPHVAGLGALAKQANPQFTPAQIKAFLQSNAVDLGPGGPDNRYGSGLAFLPDLDPCAGYDDARAILHLPCLGVGGSFFWLDLEPTAGIWGVAGFGIRAVTDTCAEFTPGDGRLRIPCLNLGSAAYRVEMGLSGSGLQLIDFEEN